MLGYPLQKPIRDKFPSLFENAVLGSLESLFRLDHQVDDSSLSLRGSYRTAPL